MARQEHRRSWHFMSGELGQSNGRNLRSRSRQKSGSSHLERGTFVTGDPHRYDKTARRSVLSANFAVMQSYGPVRNGKPDSESAGIPLPGAINPVKRKKDLLRLIFRDAGAFVADFQHHHSLTVLSFTS